MGCGGRGTCIWWPYIMLYYHAPPRTVRRIRYRRTAYHQVSCGLRCATAVLSGTHTRVLLPPAAKKTRLDSPYVLASTSHFCQWGGRGGPAIVGLVYRGHPLHKANTYGHRTPSPATPADRPPPIIYGDSLRI